MINTGHHHPCPRCMPGNAAEREALDRELAELIGTLDDDVRADDSTIDQRLAICRDCRWLDDGLCMLCGCYVIYRAAQKYRDCPSKEWGQEMAER